MLSLSDVLSKSLYIILIFKSTVYGLVIFIALNGSFSYHNIPNCYNVCNYIKSHQIDYEKHKFVMRYVSSTIRSDSSQQNYFLCNIMFRGLQTNSLCNNPSHTTYFLEWLPLYENLLIMIMYRHT
jgi:hypothetical protein